MRRLTAVLISFALAFPSLADATTQVLIGAPNGSMTTNTTKYQPVAGDAGNNFSSAGPLSIFAIAGTVSSLYANVTSAVTGSNTLVMTLYVNGSPTSLTCTITGGATTCSDTSHSASVSVGDYAYVVSAGSGAGAVQYESFSMNFVPTTANETAFFGGVVSWNTASERATGLFSTQSNASIANAQTLIAGGGTVDNMYSILASSPGAGKSFTIKGNLNSSDQTLSCVISDAATTCNDTSHSYSYSAADTGAFTATPSGTPTASISSVGARYVPSTAGNFLISAANSSGTFDGGTATRFLAVSGSGISATENQVQAISNAMTVNTLRIKASRAGGAGTTKRFTFMINGVDSSATCDMADTATTCAWSGTVSVSAGDLIDIKDEATVGSPLTADIRNAIAGTVSSGGGGTVAPARNIRHR